MKKTIFICLLPAFYSISLFAQTNVTSEEYAVYNAVLESRYKAIPKQYGVKRSFVVSAETVT